MNTKTMIIVEMLAIIAGINAGILVKYFVGDEFKVGSMGNDVKYGLIVASVLSIICIILTIG